MLHRCRQVILVAGLVGLVALEARRPTWQPASAPRPTPGSYLPLGPEVEFLIEVALRPKFGDSSEMLRRWSGEVRVGLAGEVTGEDREAAARAVAALDGRAGRLRIRVAGNPNLTLHFIEPEEFRKLEPAFDGRSRNIAWCRWDGSGKIERGRVLVDPAAAPEERAARVHELLLRALGLLGDSRQRWPSVLQRDPARRTSEYSKMDLAALGLLYHPALRWGMTPGMVRDALRASR